MRFSSKHPEALFKDYFDYLTSDQEVTSPVYIFLICSDVRSDTSLSLFTITAIPSSAITVGVRACVYFVFLDFS